jgi:hypothetical protein
MWRLRISFGLIVRTGRYEARGELDSHHLA